MPFDLRQLRHALAAAKLGSYHHAARVCEVDEETIATGIAALERLLRLRLFEPAGTGVLPTRDGVRFLREAEHLLWRAEQIASLAAAIPAEDPARDRLFGGFESVEVLCTCADHEEIGPLAQMGDPAAAQGGHARADDRSGDTSGNYVGLCRSIFAARKQMARVFGADLFADPAGEMLLDLYLREHDGIKTSITTIWNPSNAAYGTARRTVAIMERRGLITREPDTQDGRRTLVLLTESARVQIEACLDVFLGREATVLDD